MAQKKNVSGGGSIRKRSNGTWEARCCVGYDPATGKLLRKSIYGKTQKEVREKLRQIAAEVDTGEYIEPCSQTLASWLDDWLAEYLPNVKPHTRASYETIVRLHLKPALGNKKLCELTPVDVQKFVNRLCHTGLNPKTVKNIHGVLHRALNQVMRIGFLRVNPAGVCNLPKIVKNEITPLQGNEVAAFLRAIHGERFETLFFTALFTGMRQSELLGLQWKDIDFNAGALYVRRQLQKEKGRAAYRFIEPKSGKPRKILPAPAVITTLRKQRAAQNQLRLAAGPAWENVDDLVFTNPVGRHLAHMTVYKDFKRMIASIGLPNARFHDMRHTFAVLSLQAGDDIKTVQENLGHHTAAFTLDVYGHVTDDMRHQSADRMERYIQGVVSS